MLAATAITLRRRDTWSWPLPAAASGIARTAVTAGVMFALTAGKARTGQALDNPVLATEGRVTLATAVPAWC